MAGYIDESITPTPRPGRYTIMKQSLYPLYKRLGVPQGRSEREQKISSPIGTAHANINIYSVMILLYASPLYPFITVVIYKGTHL